MTLDEVDALPAAEVNLWREYHKRNGWPLERIVWTVAIVGANLCAAWGSKKKPIDFVPKFVPQRVDVNALIAHLSAMPGAKVKKIPRKVNDGR